MCALLADVTSNYNKGILLGKCINVYVKLPIRMLSRTRPRREMGRPMVGLAREVGRKQAPINKLSRTGPRREMGADLAVLANMIEVGMMYNKLQVN